MTLLQALAVPSGNFLLCKGPIRHYPHYTVSQKKAHITLINNTKKEYYQNRIRRSENSTRALWGVVSELTNKKKNQSNILLHIDDKTLDDPYEISMAFNEYFVDSAAKIVNSININSTQIKNTSSCVPTVYLEPYTEFELYNLLSLKLKNKRSSGPDDIPDYILKEILPIIITPVTFLVNMSFKFGVFPDDLKIGKIIPIHKKNDIHALENYRPVTVLNSLSKVFEYAFLDRFQNFIYKHNVLNSRQHGFNRDKSTMTALLSFYDYIVDDIDAGGCPASVLCDLSRAFDCVNHEKLIDKLRGYGVRGVASEWLTSYLSGRKQYVSLHHCVDGNLKSVNSNLLTFNMGVPQGSVLGPFLFILYVNDIDLYLGNTPYVSYADDFSLIVSGGDDGDDAGIRLGASIESAADYFMSHDLLFNTNKTQIIRFHNWQADVPPLAVVVRDNTIRSTDGGQFLGLYFDQHLNWKQHCENLISKLSSLTFLFSNLRAVLGRKQLITVYYAQVESRLRYGICLWGNSTMASSVLVAQKRIIRRIAGVGSDHSCRPLFSEYGLLPLACIYIYLKYACTCIKIELNLIQTVTHMV